MDASGSRLVEAHLARIIQEDAVGQLWRRDGAMARLGSEGDALKLDWVAAVPWLLAHPEALAQVEAEARTLHASGVHHLIWAGMGGSVLTVRVLRALGYCDGPVTIYPLDSTDPAALNGIVRAIAAAKGLDLPERGWSRDTLASLLGDVALIAVAMGMTSEEPISHLAWMAGVLTAAGLPLDTHLSAMSLPSSYLDAWASERGVPRGALQLDGGSGTGGRMSAPGTRVFLAPAALWLAGQSAPDGALSNILRGAWEAYDFAGAQARPAAHPYIRLAAELAAASVNGCVRLTIAAPGAWGVTRDWAEQLFEESLGKGGHGVVIFAEEGRTPPTVESAGEVWLRITGDASAHETPGVFTLREPLLASHDANERLAGLAALMLGLQLTTALCGYLLDIPFAGQPAVEDYKARARALRDGEGDPLPSDAAPAGAGRWTALAPDHASVQADVAAAVQSALRTLPTLGPLPYLDVTINGEASAATLVRLHDSLRALAVTRLGVPYKLRRAPAAYHSTEQSEMDGPPALVSLRALALSYETPALGEYSPRFLHAQAVATVQAMTGVGRQCFLLIFDGDADAMVAALADLFDALAERQASS